MRPTHITGLPWWLMVNSLPAMQETHVQSLGQEDRLEKGMATDSSILAWKIPWTEESTGLHPMGSQKVRHNQATNPYSNIHTHIMEANQLYWVYQLKSYSHPKTPFTETPRIMDQMLGLPQVQSRWHITLTTTLNKYAILIGSHCYSPGTSS